MAAAPPATHTVTLNKSDPMFQQILQFLPDDVKITGSILSDILYEIYGLKFNWSWTNHFNNRYIMFHCPTTDRDGVKCIAEKISQNSDGFFIPLLGDDYPITGLIGAEAKITTYMFFIPTGITVSEVQLELFQGTMNKSGEITGCLTSEQFNYACNNARDELFVTPETQDLCVKLDESALVLRYFGPENLPGILFDNMVKGFLSGDIRDKITVRCPHKFSVKLLSQHGSKTNCPVCSIAPLSYADGKQIFDREMAKGVWPA